jgi:hypothetical protein
MTNPTRLRTLFTAAFLLLPTTVFALDNGNQGTPQNDCERGATSDYYANLDSCRANLKDNPQQEGQCEQDASYDYLDAIQACKKTAAIGTHGGGLTTVGGLGNASNGTGHKGLGQSIGKLNGLKFAKN